MFPGCTEDQCGQGSQGAVWAVGEGLGPDDIGLINLREVQ